MNSRAEFNNPEVPGYVGFANLPNQVHRKSVKKGFEFTMMVVGESGLGKSTLVNSLFLTDLYPERQVGAAPTAGHTRMQSLLYTNQLGLLLTPPLFFIIARKRLAIAQ